MVKDTDMVNWNTVMEVSKLSKFKTEMPMGKRFCKWTRGLNFIEWRVL